MGSFYDLLLPIIGP